MLPPASIDELLARADRLAGRSLAEVAATLGEPVPDDQRRAKGWIGRLVEIALGARGGSRAERDFPDLGVELKTLPVDLRGRPRESTYVCTAPLDASLAVPWEESWVRRKLLRVLWIPVVGDGPVGERIVGAAVPWTPSAEQDALLRADWDLLTELLVLGDHERVDARLGAALQVRPKAADASSLAWTFDEDGEAVRSNPRGFYLRAAFTRRIVEEGMRSSVARPRSAD